MKEYLVDFLVGLEVYFHKLFMIKEEKMGMKKMLIILAFCFLLSFSFSLGFTIEENDAGYVDQLVNPGKISCVIDSECASGYTCDNSECISSTGDTGAVFEGRGNSIGFERLGTEEDTTGARFNNGLLGEFSLSSAAECTDYTDCSDDEVCVEGLCVGYCGFGDAVCSNGIDEDSDGSYDYYGACEVEGVVYPCYEEEELIGYIGQEYCYFYNAIGEWDNCDEYSGAYLEGDSDCVSPLDTSEGTVSTATTESKQSRLGSSSDGVLSGTRSAGGSLSGTSSAKGGISRAAETDDQGFFASIFDWIIFWN
jgi:hypothetical protein